MMSEKAEESELGQGSKALPKARTLDPSPPTTPAVYKFAVTPSSPTRMSSNGGSLQGTGANSQGSLSSRNKLLEPSLTPVDQPIGSSKFLYVRERLRRPSLLSDVMCRTPKNEKSNNPRMGNLKKDLIYFGVPDRTPPIAPPNTPSPSGWRNPSITDLSDTKPDDSHNDSSFVASDVSSQVTTKALASDSDNASKAKTSTETLSRPEKSRPLVPLDSNFGSNAALNWSDHLNYLQATRSGHTGLRSVGSTAFIKSFWGQKNHKNLQHHCFMSDITDVRQMEHALLQLLEDFHSGKLRAFAKDCSMEQMQGIREQQERLARLHFDLGAQQDLFAPLSEEGLSANQENMHRLMGSLEQLSLSIEKLQLFSKDANQS